MMLNQPVVMGSSSFSTASPPRLMTLCRMCASPCGKGVPIFGSAGIENELAVKFNSYLPVKISDGDTLPLQLCYECTSLLIQWDAAVLVAIATDKKLRALQWREQQSLQLSTEKSEESSRPSEPLETASPVGEPLGCSVCNQTVFGFRQLVEHLKSHKEPRPDPDESITISLDHSDQESSDQRDSDLEQCIAEGLLEPAVCLETLDKDTDSNKRMSDGSSRTSGNTPPVNPSRARRGMKRASAQQKTSDAEGDSGDPVVTSSTSASSKSSESRKESSVPSSFVPKVRIISAESINQTLEERAKANQLAKHVETRSPDRIPSDRLGEMHPKPTNSPPTSRWTKVVIPGNVIKAMSSCEDKTGMKAKFLKLSDGRVIRLLGNLDKNSKVSKAVFASTSVTRQIPEPIMTQLVRRSVSEKQSVLPSSKKSPAIQSLLSPPKASTNGDNEEAVGQVFPLKQNVKLSCSRIITFNLQPGPKHGATRYMCAYCGKRNLQQDLLQDHAQIHSPNGEGSNQNTSQKSTE